MKDFLNIPTEKKTNTQIQSELLRIEKEYGVTIFYACESGSRAWGFESVDSDYDVRFLYYHPLEWYLSLDKNRDVIEIPIDDSLDISGWELRKSLGLLRKSNPPLLEWLQSPIVYKKIHSKTEAFAALISKYYSKKNCFHHYLHMAQGNFREFLRGDEVRVKKYFYVLRPILACIWIENFDEPVPMEFGKLVDRTIDDNVLLADLSNLIERKRSGTELAIEPRIESISSFIESELNRLSEKNQDRIKYQNFTELNQVFRNMILTQNDKN